MKEKLKCIGKVTTIIAGGMKVKVRILDFKSSYGHDRYLVTPVEGEGEVWTEQVNID